MLSLTQTVESKHTAELTIKHSTENCIETMISMFTHEFQTVILLSMKLVDEASRFHLGGQCQYSVVICFAIEQ